MQEYVYINELKGYYLLAGSVGIRRYFYELYEIFSFVSDTLPGILKKDVGKPETKHDIDLVYVGNIDELAKKYPKLIYKKTIDLLVLEKKDKSYYPNVKVYDVYVCPDKVPYQKYFFYMFYLVGKQINIILSNKMIKKGMKYNKKGVFRGNKDVSLEIKFNYKKNMFYNIMQIIKYIYK